MPKNTAAAGNRRENDVKRILEAEGWEVIKTRLSKSPIDLFARKGVEQLLVQVKANKGSPTMNFRKEEREALLEELSRYNENTSAWLVHWPPHGTCDWYSKTQWTNTSRGRSMTVCRGPIAG